jgi:hypothetical protein
MKEMKEILTSLGLAIVLGLTAAACASDTVTTPSTTVVNVTGTWKGSLPLSSTTATMTWTLTETNSSVTGPVVIAQPSGLTLLNGTFTGNISGNALSYTIAAAPGGIPSQPTCTAQLGGTVTVPQSTATTLALTGSYSLTSSTCSTLFSSGDFTLAKQ